ncbi:hypothetical protein [Parashewanella tropica]|uniref:hypothetical protein n=1 Tax=Parashewanella tropica TaxID=2547970 RepID=UPI001059E5E5|nr:hypothetical protein [Parashewanella tropica]
MTIEDKVNFILLLVLILTIIFTLNALVNMKVHLFKSVIDRKINRLDKLDTLGKYNILLENVEHYIELYPDEINFHWRKARALYKTEQFELAREHFLFIADSEPTLKSDADQYIERINAKLGA